MKFGIENKNRNPEHITASTTMDLHRSLIRFRSNLAHRATT